MCRVNTAVRESIMKTILVEILGGGKYRSTSSSGEIKDLFSEKEMLYHIINLSRQGGEVKLSVSKNGKILVIRTPGDIIFS